MAERSGELNKGTEIKVGKTDAINKVNDSFDNTDLENRSTANFGNDEKFDTNMDETSDDTEKIRTHIVETRSQMSETIDAIQEKLSFSNISEQVSNIGEQVKDEVSEHISSAIQTAKDSVYDATLGKVGNVMNYVNKGMNEVADTKLGHTIRKNPLPIALIGLGLGMLYMNKSEKRSQYRYNRNKTDYDYDREGGYDRREFSSRNNQSTLTSAQTKVSDAAGKVGETVSGAAGAISDTVSDVAGKAYEQVGNLGSQVKDVAGSAQDQYEYYMDENPLAVGAVALALGAAVGISIPSTRFEGELMGETRDNLMQKAEETARGTIDKVKSVAGEVTEKVKNVAGEVAQTVKDSTGDVIQTVKDESNKQGLT
ncbi:MAG TPA: DUF3618 domain-containing protein [Pyrinomonadaceae bacterium]|nr:DUF3618 domain-containing protein [Pyrinomonadaceae bacterium]